MGRRDIFGELMEGAAAMKAHREGKITLRTHKLDPAPLPKVALKLIELLGAELLLANRRVEEAAFVAVPTRLARAVLRLVSEAAASDGAARSQVP